MIIKDFTKSRSIKQLSFYLKYFIIIREWFKESQNIVPEYIDENIYYLGSSYAFIWQNINQDILFNGNYFLIIMNLINILKDLDISLKMKIKNLLDMQF